MALSRRALNSTYFRWLPVPVAAILFVTHRPQAFISTTFWGEEGRYFYAQPYDLGWPSVLLPAAGYLCTIQRLVGLAVQPLSLSLAAAGMHLAALIIEMLPIGFICSCRLNELLPQAWMRWTIALGLAVLGGMDEMHLNLTVSGFELALLSCFIAVAPPAVSRAGRAFDLVAIVATCLTGPFVLFFAPLFTVMRHRLFAATAWACLGLQCTVVLVTHSVVTGSRSTPRLAAVADTIAGHLVLAPVVGTDVAGVITLWLPAAIALAVVWGLLLGFGFWKSPRQLRLLLLLGLFGLLGGFVRDPLTDLDVAGHAERYFFLLEAASLIAMVWFAARHVAVRRAAVALGALALLTTPLSWADVMYWPADLSAAQQKVDAHQPAFIPARPPGWSFVLH